MLFCNFAAVTLIIYIQLVKSGVAARRDVTHAKKKDAEEQGRTGVSLPS
jgi:hypothetical protein